MSVAGRIKIGFIPLVDAASLFVAVDMGFVAEEGLNVELVREVSWSNIRDRMAIGHYDAAHLLAPMAIAASLGLSHVRAPVVAAMTLAMNGNAITVSRDLHAQLLAEAGDDLGNPSATARALKEAIASREKRGAEPLTFGVTFPFSTHNYQLRYWMAEGGVNPDRDLRLVVLPPPFMVDALAGGQIDGFCVGAPWNAVAESAGVGVVLHPGFEIFNPAPEKTLAVRAPLARDEPALVEAMIRACVRAADHIQGPENREEVVALLSRPDRVGADPRILQRTLEGRFGRATTSDYLIFGDRTSGRPHRSQAAWLYAQMLRWGQADSSPGALRAAESVFDPVFFDAATKAAPSLPATISAFSGPPFEARAIDAYLDAFAIRAPTRSR